jgi:DNA-binding response OmpR family regulator
VILDLGLPDLDGQDVIAGLRGWTTMPILVLYGRSDSADKVDALGAGADDYLTKPFAMDELLARLAHSAGAPRTPTLHPRSRSATSSSTSTTTASPDARIPAPAPQSPSRSGSPRPNGQSSNYSSPTPDAL